MKTIEFQDLDRHELTVQYSSLATEAALRVYIKRDALGTSPAVDACLHLNYTQAKILMLAMEDLMREES